MNDALRMVRAACAGQRTPLPSLLAHLRARTQIRRRTGLLLAFYLLKDLETQANQQMSRNMRKYHARAAAKQFSKGAYNPRMVKATQHLRVLAAPTKIRRETFDSFFVSCGVRLPSTSDLRRRNRERFEAFKYDTEHFVASLQRRVIRGGCDEAFLRLTSEFAERCQHLHVQARRSTSRCLLWLPGCLLLRRCDGRHASCCRGYGGLRDGVRALVHQAAIGQHAGGR